MFNFIIGLIIGGVGVWVIKSKLDSSAAADVNDSGGRVINPEQVKQRRDNLERVLEMAREKGEISNDDVQKALGVSDATAERYLQELESQGKLGQIGQRGARVIYKIK